MTKLTVHQPIEGVNSLDTVDVDQDRADFLLLYGYASTGTSEEAPSPADEAQGGKPAESANKTDWVDYAVTQGDSREDAENSTKAELVERHG